MKLWLVCAALFVASIGASCKGRRASGFDARRIQRDIETRLAGSSITAKVTCPAIESDSTTSCTAKTRDGKSFTVEVTTKGKMASFEPKGLVVGAKVERHIKKHYATRFEFKLDELRCPPLVVSGETPTCSGKAQGVNVKIGISYDGAILIFKPVQGLITGTQAATRTLRQLEDGGVVPKRSVPTPRAIATGKGPRPTRMSQGRIPPPGPVVDCGFRLRTYEPGARFTCKLVTPDGKETVVHAKIVDAKGSIAAALTPPE